ncbi:hypothetical protein Gogos_000383 [Gossypium gossypioides]|uniref:DUF4283 domain-containing protein n=1 Tax=Gossypium gossypioides TaxID=34282 RepID=A0A7J9CSP1_GOSGO|nr:hypothetical protein [Gossypium gossypioides]
MEEGLAMLLITDGEEAAMHATLANLWHPHGGVTITYLGEKRFLFQFYYKIDLDQPLEGSRCTFNNHLLAFHRLREWEDPMLVSLFWSNFLVQYEVKSLHQGYGGYIRIQVRIDMRNSLIRMKKLILGSKWCLYTRFRYEKLSLEFEWDLSINAIPKRAMVASSPWLREKGEGPRLGELKKALESGQDGKNKNIQENLDSNREFIEEDCLMEIGEGKKRPRNTRFSFVSSKIDSGKTINRLSLFMILRYRLALQDRAAGCNENIMLKCLGFREPPGKTSPSGINVSSDGTMDGLSLGWKQGIRVILRSFSLSHIDVNIEGEVEGAHWRFTKFYGADQHEQSIREFRLEATLLLEESCEGEVRRLWNGSDGLILDIIRYVRHGLMNWARENRQLSRITLDKLRMRVGKEEMEQIAYRYFTDLVTSKGRGDNTRLLTGILVHVTDGMNDFLRSRLTKEETGSAM